MADLLNFLDDSMSQNIAWGIAGLLLIEALALFVGARKARDKEIHIGQGGVAVRTRQDGADEDEGDSVSLGLVLNIAGAISVILSLVLGTYLLS